MTQTVRLTPYDRSEGESRRPTSVVGRLIAEHLMKAPNPEVRSTSELSSTYNWLSRSGTSHLQALIKLLLVWVLGVSETDKLTAQVTYTYTGMPFTFATSGLTTANYISGAVTLSSALAPSLTAAVVTPLSYSFTDGLHTVNQANTLSSFVVSTDAAGLLTAWDFTAYTRTRGDPEFEMSRLLPGQAPTGTAPNDDTVSLADVQIVAQNTDTPGTWCASNSFTGFKQATIEPGVVPLQFGPRETLTARGGCALCSVASMITQFGVPMTPDYLNRLLISANGYSLEDDLDFTRVQQAVQSWVALRLDYYGDAPTSMSCNDFLNTFYCALGEKVIIQLNVYVDGSLKLTPSRQPAHHYILVTGELDNDWSVWDPGWANAPTTLSGHCGNGFINGSHRLSFTVNGYRTFKSGGLGCFAARAQSPLELTVSDPMGQIAGYDSSAGTNIFDIPGSGYAQDGLVVDPTDVEGPAIGDPTGIKSVYIPSPLSGEYHVIAIGTTNGDYTIDLQTEGPGVLNESATYSGTVSTGVFFTNEFTVLLPPQILVQPTSEIISTGGTATFAVQATGSPPLTYQWRKYGTNLTDNSRLTGSTTTNLVISNVSLADAGHYSVTVSNAIAVANSSTVGLDLTFIQNGAFQTGDFSYWETNGDYTYTYIDDGSGSGILPYIGSYEAVLGTSEGMGFLSQTLPTVPGMGYVLSFWLINPYQDPDVVQALWNGEVVFGETNINADRWKNIRVFVRATAISSALQFGFEDQYAGTALDEIALLPSDEIAPANIAGANLINSNLVLNGVNGVLGETYCLFASTNLATPLNLWTPVATNTLSTSGSFRLTVTNAWSATVLQRFYILRGE